MVYLDYAATTPLNSDVLSEMEPYLHISYGNASSVHSFGRNTRMAIERARQQVANLLGAAQKEIIFTSSASESNNLALKGTVEAIREHYGKDVVYDVLSSPTEHPCVIESLRHLEKLGWIRVVWVPVDSTGMVHAEDVERAFTDRTILVSIMYVNNEIGTRNPILDISRVILHARKIRFNSLDRENNGQSALPLYFHTDAVQAIQFYDCSVDTLGVDMLTLSAHKVYGPQGVGVLYLRDGVRLTRQLDGGGQEYYYRAGTENAAGIVGAGKAFSLLAASRDTELKHLSELQAYLFEHVIHVASGIQITGSIETRAPHISSFFIENTDSEALIIALDRAGFAISSGSACSSGIVKQSPVIQALGLSEESSRHGAPLRISTGRDTTKEQLTSFINAFGACLHHVRQFS